MMQCLRDKSNSNHQDTIQIALLLVLIKPIKNRQQSMSMIHAFLNISRTIQATTSCNVSNGRAAYGASESISGILITVHVK